MAVLLLLTLLLIVLLCKCHSRKGGKASKGSTTFAIKNIAFEANEPVHESTADIVVSKTSAETHSQHNETRDNENRSQNARTRRANQHYVDIHSQYDERQRSEIYEEIPHDRTHDTRDSENYAEIQLHHDETQESEDYEPLDITISTEHTEIHGTETYDNGAYPTSTTSISMESHAAFEENAAYGVSVNNQDDYEEYVTINPTEHIETDGNEAYQTTATANPAETHSNGANPTTATTDSTRPNAINGGQQDDLNDYEENAAYGGRVNYQYDYEDDESHIQ